MVKSHFAWKIGFILAVVAASLWYSLPLKDTIKLGLDLQGGMHLLLEVEADKAVESSMERFFGDIRRQLSRQGVQYEGLRREGAIIRVSVASDDDRLKLEQLLAQDFTDLVVEQQPDGELNIQLRTSNQQDIEEFSVDQAMETIRNRVDQFGVAEPTLQRQGDRRLIVQLPGIEDPERAKELIGRTALLEFKLVDDQNSLDEALEGRIPPGDEILYQVETDPHSGQQVRNPFLIKRRTLLTGASLRDARVSIGGHSGGVGGEAVVSIEFDAQGGRTFERVTSANVGRRLAIILDNRVYSAPVIQDRISGGQASVTGNFSSEEARDLAIVLRAGALPAPVTILEERTVGPSLGRDSIRTGLISILIGGVGIVLFMAIYYRFGGILADFALFLNLLILMGALGGLRATLTLPGIAGILLTIGMAVDANVLILERIREELRLGKTIRAAVEQGYNRAFLTILDANVTTLIAAIVLFQFGTGPVKGFAVTLSIGILASMFTAIFVTRVIYDLVLVRREVRSLAI